MDELTNFHKWGHLDMFDIGTPVLKDGCKGIIMNIIFARCYHVHWENGQENHAYHHELKRVE